MTPKYFIQHDYKHDRCHVRGNRESLVTQRSFSGRKQLLWDCFFTVNKIKTNLLPLATKDLVSKMSKYWTTNNIFMKN